MNGITATRENLISGNVNPILCSFVFYCCRYVRFALTAQRRFNWPSINGVALPPTPITIAELSRHFYEVIERQQSVNTFRAVQGVYNCLKIKFNGLMSNTSETINPFLENYIVCTIKKIVSYTQNYQKQN